MSAVSPHSRRPATCIDASLQIDQGDSLVDARSPEILNSFWCILISTSRRRLSRGSMLAVAAVLSSCTGAPSGEDVRTPETLQGVAACGDQLKTDFRPDANTTIILVKHFMKGEPLVLPGGVDVQAALAAPRELCLVKMIVGPGHMGSAGAPSISAGIGIEVWLPEAGEWNERIRNLGGGGWAGGHHSSTTLIGDAAAAMTTAKGYVVGTTDTGHTIGSGSFAMREDGTINSVLWRDFAERSLQELAIKTKALVQAYYGRSERYAYWEGCSTGGRQGYKVAQEHPEHYDGYLNGAPAFNWTRFITSELYPQVVMQRDLQSPMSMAKLNYVSAAAVSACDLVGGQHLGFILDPAQCRYDPTRDASVLCKGMKGTGVVGASADAVCVSPAEARAFNKIWYGQTADGTVPDPQVDNADSAMLSSDNHLWWGLKRGTQLAMLAGASDAPPFFGPFPIASDVVALELQSASYAIPTFKNSQGDGMNRWAEMTYADLAHAYRQGILLQRQFGGINTDNPDLGKARDQGAKIISYHGLADQLITPDGSINYYTRVSSVVGGYTETQKFNRLYLVPGMGHCSGVGAVSGTAGPALTANNVPLPSENQFFDALVDWVERGRAPDSFVLKSANGEVTLPICSYPKKIKYQGSGAITSSMSYACQ